MESRFIVFNRLVFTNGTGTQFLNMESTVAIVLSDIGHVISTPLCDWKNTSCLVKHVVSYRNSSQNRVLYQTSTEMFDRLQVYKSRSLETKA